MRQKKKSVWGCLFHSTIAQPCGKIQQIFFCLPYIICIWNIVSHRFKCFQNQNDFLFSLCSNKTAQCNAAHSIVADELDSWLVQFQKPTKQKLKYIPVSLIFAARAIVDYPMFDYSIEFLSDIQYFIGRNWGFSIVVEYQTTDFVVFISIILKRIEEQTLFYLAPKMLDGRFKKRKKSQK